MRYSVLIMIFVTAVLSASAPLQPDKVKGGYSKCEVNSYDLVFDEDDSIRKTSNELWYYDINGNGHQVEDTYFNDKGKEHQKISYKYNDKWELIERVSSSGSYFSRDIFKYDETGKETEKTSYSDNTFESRICTHYDSKGNILEVVEYDSNGIAVAGNIYEYDSSGRLIMFNDNIELGNYEMYRYDENGLKTEMILYYSKPYKFLEKRIDKYNKAGKVVERIYYKPEGTISGREVFKYDEKGKEIERIEYRGDGAVICKHTAKYDEKGNLAEKENCRSDTNCLKITYSNKYNKSGILVERIRHNSNGSIENIEKYDDNGNLVYEFDGSQATKKYRYDEYGNILSITFYSHVIEFYKDQYQYYENGKLKEKVQYNFDSTKIIKSFYNYDDRGNQTEILTVGPDDSTRVKETYKYDDRGNEIERIIYHSDTIAEIRNFSYIYDSNGRWIERFLQLPDGSSYKERTKNYDEKGNLTGYKRYYQNGDVLINFTVNYNENGKTEIFVLKGKDGSNLDSSISIYHEKAGLIEKEIYFSGGDTNWIRVHKYDEKGREIKSILYDRIITHHSDDVTRHLGFRIDHKSEYIYDEKGNWIVRHSNRSNMPNRKREYIYSK